MNNTHGAVFRGNELFVTNATSNNILRFTFNGSAQPVAHGAIVDHLSNQNLRFASVNAAGDLFASQATLSSQQITQWTFDAGGNAVFVRTISTPGSNDHGIVFAPWGEMFVAESNTNSVARFTKTGAATR